MKDKKPSFSVVRFYDRDEFRVLEEDTQEFVCRTTNQGWAINIAAALTLVKELHEEAEELRDTISIIQEKE